MKKIVLGIDIGGTSTKFGLVSGGKILSRGSIVTCLNDDPDDFVKRLKEALGTLQGVSAVGVGAPNGNAYRGTIELAPNLKWQGIVPMAQMLKQAFNLPTFLTNDANAAAMGEMIYGSAKGMSNFICITLGTGLGSGLVVDGKIVLGHSGFAGEMGQIIMVPQGRACACGRFGCLETYVSATGIVRTVRELLASEETESSLRLMDELDLTSARIFAAAEKKDAIALKAFALTAEMLGLALANAVHFTSPEAIFLFGGLTRSGPYLLLPTEQAFARNLHNIYQGTVKLCLSGLPEDDAAILGAASLTMNN